MYLKKLYDTVFNNFLAEEMDFFISELKWKCHLLLQGLVCCDLPFHRDELKLFYIHILAYLTKRMVNLLNPLFNKSFIRSESHFIAQIIVGFLSFGFL